MVADCRWQSRKPQYRERTRCFPLWQTGKTRKSDCRIHRQDLQSSALHGDSNHPWDVRDASEDDALRAACRQQT